MCALFVAVLAPLRWPDNMDMIELLDEEHMQKIMQDIMLHMSTMAPSSCPMANYSMTCTV